MRPKYSTEAVVLSRTPVREAGLLLALLSEELGLVRAYAEGMRRSGALLAHALQTFDESSVTLVRGRDGWRVTGAVLLDARFRELDGPARRRAARVAGLLLRLVHDESADPALHKIFSMFIAALPELGEDQQDAAESLAVLGLLRVLGVDAGDASPEGYSEQALKEASGRRTEFISRINRGIAASGL